MLIFQQNVWQRKNLQRTNINFFSAFLFSSRENGSLYILRMFLKQEVTDIVFVGLRWWIRWNGKYRIGHWHFSLFLYLIICLSLFCSICCRDKRTGKTLREENNSKFSERYGKKLKSSKAVGLYLYSRYFYFVQFKISHQSDNYRSEEFFFLKEKFLDEIY